MRLVLALGVLGVVAGCNQKIAECGKLVDAMELARESVSAASSRGVAATKKALASARSDVSGLRMGDATLIRDRDAYLRVLDELDESHADEALRDETSVVSAINEYCGGR